MEDRTARRMALYAIILAAMVIVLAAKTQFTGGVSTIEEAWINSIYGLGADGGHKHDDQDLDGHAPKIDGRWHVSWGVPAAKNPAGVVYELQCTPAVTGTSRCIATLDEESIVDSWDTVSRYLNGGPEFLYLRSATLTPQICATCQIVNRGATYCRGQIKIDFLAEDAGTYLDASISLTTGTTSLDNADAGSTTSTMIISGYVDNPYIGDGGSKTGGRMQSFIFKLAATPADGGVWDGRAADPEGCAMGVYWCTVWECDTDAGTQAGPAW